ncbi:MAG: two-component regulator propeller domain-containing protein, partial [Bacteroidia bacterium]
MVNSKIILIFNFKSFVYTKRFVIFALSMPKHSILLLLFAFISCNLNGQNWIIYNTQNSGLPANEVLCVTQDDDNNKWIGTYWGGVAKFTNTQWTVYTDTNSAMPHYSVRAIAIDEDDNKWFGTPAGVAKFDDTDFTIYNTANSPLPSDFVNLIRIDDDNNIWIGTNNGLAKFDGQNWEAFTTSNSGIPSNYIQCMEIDDDNNLWIGTYGGLAFYHTDDDDWEVFNTSNSPIEDNTIYAIGLSENNKVWIRTFSEIARYNGNMWMVFDQYSLGQPNSFCRTIPSTDSNSLWIGGDEGMVQLYTNQGTVDSAAYFNSLNSGLPNNGVITLFADDIGNLWAGVSLGNLVVYNPDGVDLTSVNEQLTSDFSLFPNPASEFSNLEFELLNNETILLETFDLSGRKILNDVTKQFHAGNNRYSFQTSEINPGIYFL